MIPDRFSASRRAFRSRTASVHFTNTKTNPKSQRNAKKSGRKREGKGKGKGKGGRGEGERERTVPGPPGLHLVSKSLGPELLLLGLVDELHENSLVLEDVTLGLEVERVVTAMRTRRTQVSW